MNRVFDCVIIFSFPLLIKYLFINYDLLEKYSSSVIVSGIFLILALILLICSVDYLARTVSLFIFNDCKELEQSTTKRMYVFRLFIICLKVIIVPILFLFILYKVWVPSF